MLTDETGDEAAQARDTFFHGTRADLGVGDLLRPGFGSNYGKAMHWVYFSGLLEPAIWGAELARSDERERIYVVEPTGPIEDDPNLTDARFPGNPTRSYRSRAPLRIVGEVVGWQGHPPASVQAMKDNVARLLAEGAPIHD